MDIKFRRIFWIMQLSCMVAVFLSPVASAWGAENKARVVKIAPEGGNAVIEDAKGRLRVVRAGDRIPSMGKVVRISENRMILVNDRAETRIVEISNGTQRVHRVSKVNQSVPPNTVLPVSNVQQLTGEQGLSHKGAKENNKPTDR